MIQNFSKGEDKGQKLILEFDQSDCLAFLTRPWTIRKPLLKSLSVTKGDLISEIYAVGTY